MKSPSARNGACLKMETEIKIQKYISECGIMSRRAAEREIAAGFVTVNGVTASIGDRMNPDRDTLCIGGVPVRRRTETLTVMLNKPAGYLTSVTDDRGRRCVTELVSEFGTRLNPVGRLDKDSEGLLLLTSDGELLQHLTHPRYSLPKTYLVTVDHAVDRDRLERLRSPMVIDGYNLRPVECDVADGSGGKRLIMVLHEGRNRQIRKMCAQVGLYVKKLKRVAVGTLGLGGLRSGECRMLTDEEIAYLRHGTGLE